VASAWFANRGQFIQIVVQLVACIFAGIKAWPDMKNNALLSPGSLLFYLLVLMVIASLFARRSLPSAAALPVPAEPLTVVESHPSIEPNATYKRKIRVVLRNDTSCSVYIQKPRWISEPGDVAIQVPFGSTFTPERLWNRHLGPWEDETPDPIFVHPRQRLRTWVGLDPTLTEDQMQRLHTEKRLGVLALPLRVGGQDIEQKIRL